MAGELKSVRVEGEGTLMGVIKTGGYIINSNSDKGLIELDDLSRELKERGYDPNNKIKYTIIIKPAD